ncbi:MAG: class I SAM-dependent methyltransferase [Mycobacterium sp.]|nr:class I SAM-dependent methyltransferase [Mycobacterium sp.]
MGEPVHVEPTRYEKMYVDQQISHGLPAGTPWDIGGPQPVVQQLVALGAIKGEVLDPGTGPGHHAIYYASQGYSATGIDSSPTAIERAKENARNAGVSVNFQVADAMTLEGFVNRFDTVVDCAFYHLFSDVMELKASYAQNLRRATKPGARLYMFEHGPGTINGYGAPRSLSVNDFLQVFPDAGWEITYLWPTTYQVNISVEAFDQMIARNPDKAEQIKPVVERFRLIQSWLPNGRAHAPFWEMHATRLD